MRKIAILTLFVFPVTVPAAEKPIEVIKLDRKDPVVYEKEIEPIFRAKCVVCHSGNLTKGKFDVGSYATVMKGSARLVPANTLATCGTT